jgi:hypothetical protein
VTEEPVFEGGEEEVFGKDGALQIIDHLAPRAKLGRIRDADEFFGGGPVLVSPGGGDGKGRLDQNQRELPGKIDGGDSLSPALSISSGGVEKEARDVGADVGGDVEEGIRAEWFAKQLVCSKEDGGGIAAASAEAGPMGDALFEMNAPTVGHSGSGLEGAEGFDGEIGVVCGDARDIAGEMHAGGRSRQREADSIGDIDLNEPRLDLMKAVLTLAQDAEPKIDLGVGGKFESAGGHGW